MTLNNAVTECQHIREEEDEDGDEGGGGGGGAELLASGQVVDDAAIEVCVGRISSLSGAASEWSSREKQTLCSQAGSQAQVAVILQCAIDVLKLKVMTTAETARVCRLSGLVEEQTSYLQQSSSSSSFSDRQRGRVASCVHKAFKEITSSSSSRTAPDTELVIAACQSTRTASTGTCIASFSNRKLQDTITPKALLNLCTSRNGLSKLSCLKMQQSLRPTKSRGPITPAEVLTCTAARSEVQTLRVTQFKSSMTENPQDIMAGKFFSMTFEMIDQVGDLYIFSILLS